MANMAKPNEGEWMSSTSYRTRQPNTGTRRNNGEVSPFDDVALEYDAWFEGEGKLIFATEVRAFEGLLSSLPKPWLEIGVGSGRFAQALGIENGVDPSFKLVKMARRRGITAFLGRGEQELFDEESFGTVFLIVTLCFVDSPLAVLKQAYRVLVPHGKIALGLVLRGSPWGKFYQQKKKQGHRFYKYATFYTCRDVVRLLVRAGFLVEKVISTLFQEPGKVHRVEEPREGHLPNAGFTVILAGKQGVNTETTKEDESWRQ